MVAPARLGLLFFLRLSSFVPVARELAPFSARLLRSLVTGITSTPFPVFDRELRAAQETVFSDREMDRCNFVSHGISIVNYIDPKQSKFRRWKKEFQIFLCGAVIGGLNSRVFRRTLFLLESHFDRQITKERGTCSFEEGLKFDKESMDPLEAMGENRFPGFYASFNNTCARYIYIYTEWVARFRADN